jgi:hypothetical protein
MNKQTRKTYNQWKELGWKFDRDSDYRELKEEERQNEKDD